jgi:nucleotidyltransferase/DNA polymerase involved in DNA repair
MTVQKAPEAGRQLTLWRLVRPRNALKVTAGAIGIVFDRIQGVTPSWGDDLTIIKGIGPTYARRLEAAGIHTFAQLAALTPEQIREKAGLSEWQGDPQEWLLQARALA